jgi:hypothetical protein
MLSILPGSIGLAMAVVSLIEEEIALSLYLNPLSALVSGIIAVILIITLRGYVVFDYEQSFIFTTNVSPRVFLITSILVDLSAYSIFIFPFYLFLGLIIVFLALPATFSIIFSSVFLLFILFLFFVKISFSILDSFRSDSMIKFFSFVLIIFLLLPGLNLVGFFPLEYRAIPYPSTFLVQTLIDVLSGGLPSYQSIFGMTFYFVSSLLLFVFCSNKNLFQVARAIPFVSPFDTSMRMQTVKMGKNIKFFSRIGLRFSLRLKQESLVRFLMKKELVRMIRDSSLFVVLLFYAIVSVMSYVTQIEQVAFPIWMLILVIYSFIVPAILIGNWRVSELDNLWIPLTSGVNIDDIVNSLLYGFTLIACVIPMGTIAFLTFIGIDPLVPLVLVLSVSLIGCSTNLFIMMFFLGKKRRVTAGVVVVWISTLLSGLLSSPVYVYAIYAQILGFSFILNIFFTSLLLVYSVSLFLFFKGEIQKKAINIEL